MGKGYEKSAPEAPLVLRPRDLACASGAVSSTTDDYAMVARGALARKEKMQREP